MWKEKSCHASFQKWKNKVKVILNGKELKEITSLIYLGNEINNEGRIHKEISRRVQCSSKICHMIKDFLWGKEIPISLKKKVLHLL